MVITGLTRNQVALTGSWVRIPPPPPTKNPVTMRVSGFFFFALHPVFALVTGCSFQKFGKNYVRFSALFCDSIPPASEVIGLRQSDPVHHGLRRGEFRSVVQMGVDVRRGGKVAVPKPFLNLLERNAVGQQERSAGVPLRYNKDKREKPVFSRGLSVCRSHFNSFSNIETDAKI